MSGKFSADSAIHTRNTSVSQAFRKDFQSLNAYDKHKRFMNDYFLWYGKDQAKNTIKSLSERHGKTEADILKENHRFLRDEDDDEADDSWEKRLAKKYYDKLFKEFCLANLERYKEGKIALRWRTQKEVVSGNGQFTCGNLGCTSPPALKLKSWEVNFAYKEDGEQKNALVKLRLCDPCAYKLNYRKIKKMEQEKKERESGIESGRRKRDEREPGDDDKEERRKDKKGKVSFDPEDSAPPCDRKNDDSRDSEPVVVSSTQQGSSSAESTSSSQSRTNSAAPPPVSGVYSKEEASKIWSAQQDIPDGTEGGTGVDEEMDAFFDELRSLATAVPGQNLIERIVQKYAVGLADGHVVRQGDFVSIAPEHVMTHDNTAAVMSKFTAIGASKFRNPRQAVFTLDHDVQNKTEKNLAKYASIKSFALKHSVDHYPAGRGIGHQIMVEEGYAFPLTLAVASDSHSNMYGGVGALGTPIVRTDAAAIWATGRTWWQVPPVVKVEVIGGPLPVGTSGKDVIVALCGEFSKDEVLNHAIEFTGHGLKHLTIDDRLTISNMTTEWGALAGVFPVDEITLSFYHSRLRRLGSSHPRINRPRLDKLEREAADISSSPSSVYAKHITLNLSSLSPTISGPNSVKVATPLAVLEAENIPIHKAYLLSCTNARASDLKAAADIIRRAKNDGLEGKVKDGVEFYVAAASEVVQKEAGEAGDWQVLVDAGAKVLPSGCGPCIGLGVGLLKDNEVGISATNRNFKGRMGSRLAKAYLSSPAVVAASALAGRIISPSKYLTSKPCPTTRLTTTITAPPQTTSSSAGAGSTVAGFPASHKGELVFCDTDNLDTDGIYAGMYTYQDDMTPKQMAEVVMKNYDPTFAGLVKEGSILVSGFNFGTGSSREQAATSLKYAGVRLIIAGSLSETFKRNALNNGLLCLECPDLVNTLRETFKNAKKPSIWTGLIANVDYTSGDVTVEQGGKIFGRYKVAAVGAAAQELVVAGGLEMWVKERL
ncbi:mitochondrial Homoaconitase [Phlyctochytrium planicorne]|nr:mitochondrial Homoaconitase [Phlyctochytrium planicorne]